MRLFHGEEMECKAPADQWNGEQINRHQGTEKRGPSRREFLIQGAAGMAALATPAFAAPAATRKVLHIIGHSHIDAAWLWPWRDSSNVVLTTFRSALDRMKETPGFCYTHSSSMHYRWVERADPAMFAEIQQRIKEKRWEVVGAWPVEPDCNIPATESFVRHSLYGKAWCKRALGVDVSIGFNPDSFGHGAGLPTILKNAGYKYYTFMRPGTHEMKLPLLFWWEGPDGSRILTVRIWGSYESDSKAIPDAAKTAFPEGFDHGAVFFGVGDHGGAVTKAEIKKVLEMSSDSSLPELRWSTLGEYLVAAESSPAYASLPVIKGDLQHHARGCYATYGEGKLLNRRAEQWLVESETISVITQKALQEKYPAQNYADAWWKVTFCQFHDIMAGTSLYSDYRDVRDMVGGACDFVLEARVDSLNHMARSVDMSGVAEGAVLLFNSLPWKRKAFIEYIAGDESITHLRARDGAQVPVQWRNSEAVVGGYKRMSAWVDLPPCGYKVFELAHGPAPTPETHGTAFHIATSGIGIDSFKAEDGMELLSKNLGMVVIEDKSDTWSHDVPSFRNEIGRPELISFIVVEDGPVSRRTRQRFHWRASEVVMDLVQYAGRDFLELSFVVDWHEHQQILMLEIPAALQSPKIFAKVPGAVLERTANGEEEPYQDWITVQGSINGAGYTVALINNGTYSYNCLDGLFRTTIVRSAPFARHNPQQLRFNDIEAWQDQGRQERTFWLLGGKGTYQHFALDRRSIELQTPAEYVMDSRHEGKSPWEQSFLEITPESVQVLAIKAKEEAEADTIIRLQERSGNRSTATLKSTLLGLDHTVELVPWELKTILVTRRGNARAEIRSVSLLEF